MIIIYSPTKTMQFKTILQSDVFPTFDYLPLLKELQGLSIKQIEKRYGVSNPIAQSVNHMFESFEYAPQNMAIAAYTGLSYQALTPFEYTIKDLDYAEQHLRILDAFYGVLTPRTMIKPYRLDFSTKLKKNLYKYWKITLDEPILNLASNEYSAMIHQPMITVLFLEEEQGKLVNKATYAKMARGKMLQYLITNHVTSIHDVTLFNEDGYRFNSEVSDEYTFVFSRTKTP
jgi:uncharacterized protein